MAKQTFTTGQVLTAAQMTSLQQTAMGGGAASTKTASYVLVAADAGTTVQMNSASATTITVNTSLFSAGDVVFIQNIGTGVCTITSGTATVTTAGSLALSQWEGGQLFFNSASAAVFFDYIQTGATSPLTTKGDIWGFSTVDARIPIGSNNTVLTADSTQALGLKWAAAASPTDTWTLLNAGGTSLTGTAINITGISGQNELMIEVYNCSVVTGSSYPINITFNADGANHNYFLGYIDAPSTYAAANTGSIGQISAGNVPIATTGGNASAVQNGIVHIMGANSTGPKPFTVAGGSTSGGNNGQRNVFGGGVYNGTSTISSVRISMADTFDGGTIYVYGRA